MSRSQRYQDSCDRTLTDLFRNLAFEEQQVEIQRQNLARLPDFDPMRAFNLIDVNGVGALDTINIIEFLRKHYVNLEVEETQDIIREYDATMDGMLTFAEFSQFVLPATNTSLRHVAENRHSSPQFRADQPLPYQCISALT
jgi:hypothetical protein